MGVKTAGAWGGQGHLAGQERRDASVLVDLRELVQLVGLSRRPLGLLLPFLLYVCHLSVPADAFAALFSDVVQQEDMTNASDSCG